MNISWIKMSVSMFDDDKIKIIETLPNGYEYIVIWVKILCMAGKKNDNGCIYLVKELPLDEAMLARVAGHNVDVFKAAISVFESFGMVSFHEGHMQLTNWAKYQDKLKSYDDVLTQNAIRQQKSRNKRKMEAEKLGIGNQRVTSSRYESRDVTLQEREGEGETERKIEGETENSDEKFLEENSETVQLPHPNLVPNKLESDGTEIPSEPLVVENHSKSERGGYSKSVQASKSPQPPDVKKVARDINEILRKKFPKDEMDIILDTSTLDLPTISEMFAEYWVYQVNRPFNKDHTSNLFSSFRYWIKIAKDKEIPAKETTSGIKSKPIMEKVLHEVGKKKRMTLSPTDAGKVNKFIAESGVSDKALEHGTKNFCSGSGNTWDQWIFVVGNAIKAEKLGEI